MMLIRHPLTAECHLCHSVWPMRIPTLTTGRRLAWAREDAGITVNQMAARLGIDRRTITRYERGGCRVPEAVLIAYQVICDVPEDFIRGRMDLRQETPLFRWPDELPLWAPYKVA